MNTKIIYPIIAINLLVLLLLVIFMPQQMIQPGKLIDAHAKLSDDCFSCHTPFLGSRSAKCISCHLIEDIGLRTTEGDPISHQKDTIAFHQDLIEDDCTACHSDHKGVQTFRPANQFSHHLIAQKTQPQCNRCHTPPNDEIHQQVTRQTLENQCSQCHSIGAWTPAIFDHEEHFELDHDHNVTCETCHTNNDYSDYTCYGCHEHTRSNIRREHVEEGIRNYENCVECHRNADEDDAEKIWKKKRKDRGRYRHDDYDD